MAANSTAKAPKNPRIWAYLDAITKTKDMSVLKDADFEKVYKPFTINQALAHHQDSVLAANLMNERHHLPVDLQFRFLLNTLRARFRKSDWLKNTVSDDVKAVAEYYGCSVRHARGILSLHSSAQLTNIYARIDKGGAEKKKVPRHDNST
jgi:hypothetical protein